MSLRYRDGWVVYSWHGLRVPARVIAGQFSAQEALAEPNAEIKRTMIEHLGAERFL